MVLLDTYAAKIALADPALAEQFALENGTELARADGAAARKHTASWFYSMTRNYAAGTPTSTR